MKPLTREQALEKYPKLSNANLSNANLSDADLSGANLGYANLSDADLSGANLRDANLRHANLSDADLSGANLRDANLSGADLSYANLSGADLSAADLRGADLSAADLRGADLSAADLRGADLSAAAGLLDPADFIAKNFSFEGGNLIAYKSFGVHYDSPESWDLSAGSVITEVVNPCRVSDCGCGVNVATLDWVENNAAGEIWKVAIAPIDLAGAVVPYHTDGKFRVGRVTLIEVV